MAQQAATATVCRACAQFLDDIRTGDASQQFQKYRQLYSTLSELQVFDDDDLPKLMCSTCAGLLESIEHFKETCIQSVDTIRKLTITSIKEEPMEEIVSAEALEPILKVKAEPIYCVNTEQKNDKPTVISSNAKRLVCHLCGKSFLNRKTIFKHMKLELKLRQDSAKREVKQTVAKQTEIFTCTQEGCEQKFKRRNYLERHCLKMHPNDKINSTPKDFYCAGCDKTLRSLGHYRRHMELVHKPLGLSTPECPMCHKTFKTVYHMKTHILNVHKEETSTFTCKSCGVRYVSESELKLHIINRHESGQNYTCHHCGVVVFTKRSMCEHIFKEHITPVYTFCNICNSNVLPSRLTAHLRLKHCVRSDLQILKCHICDKEFKRSVMLNRHLKIHSSHRAYVCHLCGMSFIRSGSLKRHFYSHSGERPIHCDICGKGLYSNKALAIHMNIHKREWIAQGQTGIELLVYATSNKSKNSTEKKFANKKQPGPI